MPMGRGLSLVMLVVMFLLQIQYLFLDYANKIMQKELFSQHNYVSMSC